MTNWPSWTLRYVPPCSLTTRRCAARPVGCSARLGATRPTPVWRRRGWPSASSAPSAGTNGEGIPNGSVDKEVGDDRRHPHRHPAPVLDAHLDAHDAVEVGHE